MKNLIFFKKLEVISFILIIGPLLFSGLLSNVAFAETERDLNLGEEIFDCGKIPEGSALQKSDGVTTDCWSFRPPPSSQTMARHQRDAGEASVDQSSSASATDVSGGGAMGGGSGAGGSGAGAIGAGGSGAGAMGGRGTGYGVGMASATNTENPSSSPPKMASAAANACAPIASVQVSPFDIQTALSHYGIKFNACTVGCNCPNRPPYMGVNIICIPVSEIPSPLTPRPGQPVIIRTQWMCQHP